MMEVKSGSSSSKESTRRSSSAAAIYSAPSAASQASRSSGSLVIPRGKLLERTRALLLSKVQEREEREKRAREGKEARMRAKEQRKANQPKSAIAHILKITTSKHRRREPKAPVPAAFFDDPNHSDEDLGEIITGSQRASEDSQKPHIQTLPVRRGLNSTQSSRQFSNVLPNTDFKPLNTLVQQNTPEVVPTLTKKFGLGYSQRVRAAFSDSDEPSEGESEFPGHATKRPSAQSSCSRVQNQETPLPKCFPKWLKNYETEFRSQPGFHSVANGPWKGLILSGPDQGKYLPGFKEPTEQQIDDQKKAAERKGRSLLVEDSEESSNSAEYGDSGDDSVKGLNNSISKQSALREARYKKSSQLSMNGIESSSSLYSEGSCTTSIMIVDQLEAAPPSNQELGLLMSSSPSKKTDEVLSTPIRGYERHIQLLSTADITSTGTSPNQLTSPATTPLRRNSAKKTRETSISENLSNIDPEFQSTGHSGTAVATPRNSTPKDGDADLDVTPSFEHALSQVETPSTRSRYSGKTLVAGDFDTREDSEKFSRSLGISDFVVKIPELPAKKLAGYKKFPPDDQDATVVPPIPLKSFREINRDCLDGGFASQDSGVAAVDYVLKESPSWLTNITEIQPRSITPPSKSTSYRPRNSFIHPQPKNANTSPVLATSPRGKKRKWRNIGADNGSVHTFSGSAEVSESNDEQDAPIRSSLTVTPTPPLKKIKLSISKPMFLSVTPPSSPCNAAWVNAFSNTPGIKLDDEFVVSSAGGPPKMGSSEATHIKGGQMLQTDKPVFRSYTPIPPPVLPSFFFKNSTTPATPVTNTGYQKVEIDKTSKAKSEECRDVENINTVAKRNQRRKKTKVSTKRDGDKHTNGLCRSKQVIQKLSSASVPRDVGSTGHFIRSTSSERNARNKAKRRENRRQRHHKKRGH
ncbi:hypothetical protein BX600DRAFT_166478 [Xylariales sp. PMI_506]|nr:hypothetical protein BX600DRAFT_166478 [Xylariales sp. PMI_506]